jgi:nicotinamide phosphoribosyltransferase
MTRIKGWDSVPVLGIQSFVKEFLIDHFNENFFNVSLKDILEQYTYVITESLGKNRVNTKKIEKLHKLGYLPLDIRAIDEGVEIGIKTPMIEISNTLPDFAWVTNSIETLMSSELWYQMVTAKVGIEYRKIANKWFEKTCDEPTKARSAISEFGYRGAHCHEGVMRASTGFLCSFNKTSTIPAIVRINEYYEDDLKNIGTGMVSSEHSIMTSSYALDGDEITLIKRLITETFPDGNISLVLDSYDYWNIIDVILPKLKDEILGRNGTLFCRGDSGTPEDIVVQTVQHLWNTFGGTVNKKGYKVLDSHIKAIYGDSITIQRANTIYSRLEKLGFSVECVALGAGSFSMLCLETTEKVFDGYDGPFKEYVSVDKLNPFTRDTFGVAIKTTYGEYIDENGDVKGFEIFKDPKTDTGNFKKSQKGCCIVEKQFADNVPYIAYTDGYTLEQAHNSPTNLLTPVFLNGKLVKETTFNEIRNRLWNGNF